MIIGTGVDIAEVSRLRKAVEKWGKDFLNRIFTEKELANARSRVNFYPHLAGRFAAKEAIYKALNIKDLNWKDFQILNDKEGRPYCEIINSKIKKVDIHISISHVKSYAVASAIITQKT